VAPDQPLEYYETNWEDDARYTLENSFRSQYDINGDPLGFEPYGPPYHSNQYLETLDYSQGRLLTVIGSLKEIKSGKNLSVPLSQSRLVPPIAIQMIAVGEQSGELEKMLFKIADIYEKETESSILALTSMLEPVMILFMALAVAYVGISILFPILQMTQMIQ